MSLRFNTHEVMARSSKPEYVLYEDDAGEKRIHPWFEQVVPSTMAVAMGDLNEDTIGEFSARLDLAGYVFTKRNPEALAAVELIVSKIEAQADLSEDEQALVHRRLVSGTYEEFKPTVEFLTPWLGLKTNVHTEPFAVWAQRQLLPATCRTLGHPPKARMSALDWLTAAKHFTDGLDDTLREFGFDEMMTVELLTGMNSTRDAQFSLDQLARPAAHFFEELEQKLEEHMPRILLMRDYLDGAFGDDWVITKITVVDGDDVLITIDGLDDDDACREALADYLPWPTRAIESWGGLSFKLTSYQDGETDAWHAPVDLST